MAEITDDIDLDQEFENLNINAERFDTPLSKEKLKAVNAEKGKRLFDDDDFVPVEEMNSTSLSLENWKYTSKWTNAQLKHMKLQYATTSKEDTFFGKHSAYLKDIAFDATKFDFIGQKKWNLNDSQDSLSKKQFRYASVVKKVLGSESRNIPNPEDYVDNLVYFLLLELDFDSLPLVADPKPQQRIKYEKFEIISECDYAVRNTKYETTSDKPAYLLIEESKRLNASLNTGKYQIAGDFLLFAFGLYRLDTDNKQDIQLYGWKMNGTKATFYRAIFSHDYLLCIDNQKIMKEAQQICEYKTVFNLSSYEGLVGATEFLMKIKHVITNLKV